MSKTDADPQQDWGKSMDLTENDWQSWMSLCKPAERLVLRSFKIPHHKNDLDTRAFHLSIVDVLIGSIDIGAKEPIQGTSLPRLTDELLSYVSHNSNVFSRGLIFPTGLQQSKCTFV